ncbi:MAG: phosphorylase family protein [Prosthecobacter sp.]
MKILIVEDLEAKAQAIVTVLNSALTTSFECTRAKSYTSAVRHLEQVSFDILLLDLVIPMRDGESATNDGGKKVLLEILDGSDCFRPLHIICLSAFRETESLVNNEIPKCLFHYVFYDELENAWKESLCKFLDYSQSRILKQASRPSDFGADVAIVTSRPAVELKAVLELPVQLGCEYNNIDSLYYYRAEWKHVDGSAVSVVSCEAPTMGMTGACITAMKLIERWRPRFLVMTGIAAGTTSDSRPGDIIVVEAAYDYGSGKIVENESGDKQFLPRTNQLRISPELQALLQRWEDQQTSMSDIRKALRPDDRLIDPRMSLGLMATGAAVVQSKNFVDSLLATSQKTVGLDMEAYAIFHAAQLCSLPRPEILVAKSVCDHADKNKGDEWQSYAAKTSARFVYEFFTRETDLRQIVHGQ